MAYQCSRCNKALNRYNKGMFCFSCQEKQLDEKFPDDEDLIDAEGYGLILGRIHPESVKRLARKGLLADRIPAIKKYQWRKKDIDIWIKNEGRWGNKNFRMVAQGVASNLRTCRNDPVINLGPLDKIGVNVYGIEPVLGTTVLGLTELIKLVEVDKLLALNMLKQLPKDDFPELKGIKDWSDMTYDIINEDLIVRLEAYF